MGEQERAYAKHIITFSILIIASRPLPKLLPPRLHSRHRVRKLHLQLRLLDVHRWPLQEYHPRDPRLPST